MNDSFTSYDAYKIFLGVKLHFNSDYDFFTYGGRGIKASIQTFESRKDRYFFEKLCKKYTSKEKFLDFLISNYKQNKFPSWVGELVDPKCDENYINWTAMLQSFNYQFKETVKNAILNDLRKDSKEVFIKDFNSLFEPSENNYPKIVKKYLHHELNKETFVILDSILNFIKNCKCYDNDPRWNKMCKELVKYKRFVINRIDNEECKKTLKEQLNIALQEIENG